MHPGLLALPDAHLAELTALRRALAAPRPVRPGERWAAAEETVRAAGRYTALAGALLNVTAV